ncbi:MAG TPA: hypothetical protein VGL23_24305 [Chloroflexota bacterium]
MSRARSLVVQHPYFVLDYPFLGDRLRRRLGEIGDVEEAELPRGVRVSSRLDLARYHFVFYSGGRLTADCVAAATSLKAVATYTDNSGADLIADDFARVWRGEPRRNALSPAAAAVRAAVTEQPY